MKKLILGIIIVLVPSVWLAFNLDMKRKYELLKKELDQQSYSIVKMDAEELAFFENVQSEWTQGFNGINGAESEGLKLLGLEPSVSSLLYFYTYELPNYSFISVRKNRKSAVIAAMQSMVFPVTVDDSIHVSEDGSTAFIHVKTNIVYVYNDEMGGLREAWYYKKVDASNGPPDEALIEKSEL